MRNWSTKEIIVKNFFKKLKNITQKRKQKI